MEFLTWKIDKQIPVECPDYKPDPYTGEYPAFHCAVLHAKYITETKSAEFETKKEVEEFIKKAPKSCYEFRLEGKVIKK